MEQDVLSVTDCTLNHNCRAIVAQRKDLSRNKYKIKDSKRDDAYDIALMGYNKRHLVENCTYNKNTSSHLYPNVLIVCDFKLKFCCILVAITVPELHYIYLPVKECVKQLVRMMKC